jgi:hypothetical protein
MGLSFLMMLLPHLTNNYYLPFHVDEWIHWSLSRAVIEQGSTTIINPYLGSGIFPNHEIGFHLATASIHWISTSTLSTIFLFMPALLGALVSLIAFVIGHRSSRRFGLEAAFLVAFIPTTVRFLGPSFYTPSTMSLLFLLFLIWLAQLRTLQSTILIPVFVFCIFLIHPVFALAGIGILLVYALLLIPEKDYYFALFLGVLTVIPMMSVALFASRWDSLVNLFLNALSGQQYQFDFNLPNIYVALSDLGLVTWGLLLVGVYFSFVKGKALLRTLALSTITFIVVIGLYYKLGYGFPSITERLFLTIFLLVTLIAGFGLSELRRTLTDLFTRMRYKTIYKQIKHIDKLTTLALCVIILLIAIPAHQGTPYYTMITENDYKTFDWIHDHIDDYRDANHSYERAVVHPYKASPFSAVTGLYIICSTMNPIYGYDLHPQMELFLSQGCTNTAFLDKYKLTVLYCQATNTNLTKIHDQVYIYPGLNKQ